MKIKREIQFFIIFTLFLCGCEKIDTGREIYVRVGERYNVNWTLSFSIDSVSDYRCPEDLICIWGGDVDLFFNIKHGFNNIDTLIHLTERNPFRIGGYIWKVLEVNPLPRSTVETDQKDFRIKMLIEKD